MDFKDGTFFREPDEAFDNAIRQGMTEPDDYMYMYSFGDNDYFKNWYTRDYIVYKNKNI